jgi:hypothetical protein
MIGEEIRPDGRIELGITEDDLWEVHLMLKFLYGDSNINQLRGLKILDIGGGSIFSFSNQEQYLPGFARAASHYGADVTVLDIKRQGEEDSKLFTGIQVDIVEAVLKNNLAGIIGNKRFAVVHSRNFIGDNVAPRVAYVLEMHKMQRSVFERLLLEQLQPLLADAAVVSFDRRAPNHRRFVYIKADGQGEWQIK